jgi:hypothetical protein
VARYAHGHGNGGIYNATATTSAARHLELPRPGHNLTAPNKPDAIAEDSLICRLLTSGEGVSQSVANQLLGFNIQRFRLAAVGWLVSNNHPITEFETPAFRALLAAANLEAAASLWKSHLSVSAYIMRLYDYLLPRVVMDLSQSLSKIHISFDGWTTKGGKRGYLGIVAHYVRSDGDLIDLPIALPQLSGAHSGERMAEVVLLILQKFGITARTIGYFVLDNATNNNATVASLALKLSFNPKARRLRCGPHTINLIGQKLLWGRDGEAYNNEVSEAIELDAEHELMEEWRDDGPLGILIVILSYIKTPQQHDKFVEFQCLAHRDKPVGTNLTIYKPIKPVITRWNSYFDCLQRAAKLQPAVNAYASFHIDRVKNEDSYATSRNNKRPDAQPWMRSDGLLSHDWAVITDYIEILKPLKTATKRLEGHTFGAIAEIIPVFEVLLNNFELKLSQFEAVRHDEHGESPKDHFAINLRAAILKAREYYNKLDHTPAYYAATRLHPRYKYFTDTAWANKPDRIELNNRNFDALWAEYKYYRGLSHAQRSSAANSTTRSIALSTLSRAAIRMRMSMRSGNAASLWLGRTRQQTNTLLSTG